MSNNYTWYTTLKKPSWAPPSWLFGPVWTFLYIIITVSYVRLTMHLLAKQLPIEVGVPFALNLFFNAIFTPIQFGLKNNKLALLDIVLLLATIIWEMIAVFPSYPWIAYAQVLYLIWVTYATILQLTITLLNK